MFPESYSIDLLEYQPYGTFNGEDPNFKSELSTIPSFSKLAKKFKSVEKIKLTMPIIEMKLPKSTKRLSIELIEDYDMSDYHELDELELYEDERHENPCHVLLPQKVKRLQLKGIVEIDNSEDVEVELLVIEQNSHVESYQWKNIPTIESLFKKEEKK